jgi:hypothetical protein
MLKPSSLSSLLNRPPQEVGWGKSLSAGVIWIYTYESRMIATVVCVANDSSIVAYFDVDGDTLFERKLTQVPVQVHIVAQPSVA